MHRSIDRFLLRVRELSSAARTKPRTHPHALFLVAPPKSRGRLGVVRSLRPLDIVTKTINHSFVVFFQDTLGERANFLANTWQVTRSC